MGRSTWRLAILAKAQQKRRSSGGGKVPDGKFGWGGEGVVEDARANQDDGAEQGREVIGMGKEAHYVRHDQADEAIMHVNATEAPGPSWRTDMRR